MSPMWTRPSPAPWRRGATVKEPVGDKFWGDRAGSVVDPFGHKWTLLTHQEDVTYPEMQRRMEKLFATMPGQGAGT